MEAASAETRAAEERMAALREKQGQEARAADLQTDEVLRKSGADVADEFEKGSRKSNAVLSQLRDDNAKAWTTKAEANKLVEAQLMCPDCGAVFLLNAKFCRKCGRERPEPA